MLKEMVFMQGYRPTWAEINLGNLTHNVKAFRQHIPQPTRLMAVVKADGYGHGDAEVARAALAAGADWLAVALVEEGIRLRQAGLAAPILILGYLPPESLSAVIQYRLTPAITDISTLLLMEDEARRQRRKVGIHLKVDTGMGRLGPRDTGGLDLAKRTLTSSHLELEGVFTHFATADDEDKGYTNAQLDKFKRLVETIKKEKPQVIAHCANSAAAIEIPQAYFDMVRIGISLYGLYPSGQVKKLIPLKPVMSLHTSIAFVKEVPAGTAISYGRTFVTSCPSRIATLPLGYADGLFRTLSGKAEFLIQGRRVPQVGRICMDYTMADITDLPEAEVGEPVVVFGNQGQEHISADDLALLTGTISYEILCAVSARVPRYYKYQA
jgi:alanine racemase